MINHWTFSVRELWLQLRYLWRGESKFEGRFYATPLRASKRFRRCVKQLWEKRR